MSASSTGIPPLIEQHLLALDKQLRDAAFVRGFGRLVFGVCGLLGGCLLLDGWLDLSGPVRVGLLIAWIVAAGGLLWRYLIHPALQPISFSTLAALVEQQFPELRERLTSLVELRGDEEADLAPGASKLMQDLLARQTVKAFDQLNVDDAASTRGSFRAVSAGVVSLLLLLAPFGWMPGGYGLLWNRFFAPWGNYAWGSTWELKVLEGDQIVARGSDVAVHVSLTDRRQHREADQLQQTPLWLNWNDAIGISDSRRLDWDEAHQQFVTVLPHVMQSLTFQVTANGAKTGTYHVDVSDPPAITQLKLEIEPAAYTGLPARALVGVPAELQVPEFTRLQVTIEFSEPVTSAELIWPAPSQDPPHASMPSHERQAVEQSMPLDLAEDRRSAATMVTASLSGQFAIRAKNQFGLQNSDPSRTLIVIPDQPPQIKLEGSDEPVLVRPDDVINLPVHVVDDFGLTAVELHAESSTGIKHVQALSDDQRREPHVSHAFKLDLAPFELSSGQIVTYRIRAVDNRPHPDVQEVWTTPRSLMINTSLKQLPDQKLASEEKSLEDQLTGLRSELNQAKTELAELHQQTEQESLNKRPESDKTERLEQLQQAQDNLIERLERLTDRLAERRMTQDLAPKTQQIADDDLKDVQERLEQSKGQPARDQLEPLAQALDRLGTADRQLKQLEQQLNDLNKLEQDIAELSRMAQRAERLADQLDKLESQQQAAATKDPQPDLSMPTDTTTPAQQNPDKSVAANGKPESKNPQPDNSSPVASQPAAADKTAGTAKQPTASTADGNDENSQTLQDLKNAGQKLADQMNDLLKKHPELLETARRDQRDRLNALADQARNLAEPQQRLTQALEQAAANAPAQASRPENLPPPQSESDHKPTEGTPNQSDLATVDTEKSPPKPDKGTPENTSNLPPADRAKGQTEKPADATKPTDPNGENDSPIVNKNDVPSTDVPPSPAAPETQTQPKESTAPTQRAESSAQQSGREAAKRQEQLAREATEQALELARETGADSEATKAAADFARKADAAKQQAESGQLDQAAKQARQAAKAADDAARQLNPDGQSNSPQSQQARKLADKQNQTAGQLEQLAQSPEAVQGAQLQGQRQLAEATNQLAEQLGRAAQSLKSAPLNSPQEGELGEKSRQLMKQAEQSMKEAELANRQHDSRQAAEAASVATQKLNQAADAVKSLPSTKPDSLPVPKEIGTKVAQATKRLDAAQEELTQCNCPQPGSGKSGSTSSQNPSGQVASNQAALDGQNPSSATAEPGASRDSSQSVGKAKGTASHVREPGQSSAELAESKGNGHQQESSQIAKAADHFREVAAMLRQIRGEQKSSAASSLAKTPEPSGQSNPSEPSEQADTGEGGTGSGGTNATLDLSHLNAELQQQARHNWGRLPGQLRTEILQGAGKKSHPEYTQRIKSYFDEITKPAK